MKTDLISQYWLFYYFGQGGYLPARFRLWLCLGLYEKRSTLLKTRSQCSDIPIYTTLAHSVLPRSSSFRITPVCEQSQGWEQYFAFRFNSTKLLEQSRPNIVDKSHIEGKAESNLLTASAYFISFNNSVGCALLYLTLITALHIQLPFLIVFTVSFLAIAYITHVFYYDDIKEGLSDIFVIHLNHLTRSEKIGLACLSPYIIGASVSMAVFSFAHIMAALKLLLAALSITCPQAALVTVGAFLAVFVFAGMAFAMFCLAKRLLEQDWVNHKVSLVKTLWQIDASASSATKIWHFTKATVITLLFLVGIGLAAYAVVCAYGHNWAAAAASAWGFLSNSAAMQIINIVCVYGLAIPIKLIFNADYTGMLLYAVAFYSFQFIEKGFYSIKNFVLSKKTQTASKSNKNFKEEINQHWETFKKNPYNVLLIFAKKIAHYGVLVFKSFCSLLNVAAKIMLTQHNPVAMAATGSYEGAKGVKTTFGVSLNKVRQKDFAENSKGVGFFGESKAMSSCEVTTQGVTLKSIP